MKSSSIHAVSPVVGVMLMLVIVIIISAVVSGFAGGLISGPQKPPTITMDVKIVNSGFWYSSGFFANVLGTTRPIPTKDLKIVTSWTIVNRTTGERESDGSTVIPNVGNINHNICNPIMWPSPTSIVAPFGGGQGVPSVADNTWGTSSYNNGQVAHQFWWGQYTLVSGTTLSAPAQHGQCNKYWDAIDEGDYVMTSARVYGSRQRFKYPDPTSEYPDPLIDPVTAVLGQNWYHLRGGDTVNVKLIYLPSNAIIFDRNVQVVEG